MDLAILNQNAVSEILQSVEDLEVISKDDFKFLQTNKEHLSKVLLHTHIWRTDAQKLSIVSNEQCPTLHSKFHQAILEAKIQFDQSLYLARDFEIAKLSLQEKVLDLEDLGDTNNNKRDALKAKKLQIEIKFQEYELQQMKTAMLYRVKEVRGWQKIQEQLVKEMESAGMSEEVIWSKDVIGEIL